MDAYCLRLPLDCSKGKVKGKPICHFGDAPVLRHTQMKIPCRGPWISFQSCTAACPEGDRRGPPKEVTTSIETYEQKLAGAQ